MEHNVIRTDQEYLARFGKERLMEAMQNIGDRYIEPTPETTTDIETAREMASRAIAGYSPHSIDHVRSAGWYNYDRK